MSEPSDRTQRLARLEAVLLGLSGLVAVGWFVLPFRAGPNPGLPSAPRLPELSESVLEIPVAYDTDALVTRIEQRTPERIGDLGLRLRYAGDPRLSYSYEAVRGPVEVRAAGDTISLSSRVRYGGRAWYRTPGGPELSTACGVQDGSVRLGAEIELTAVLNVSPDWTPVARVEVSKVEPLGPEDRCVVGLFAFQADVTETIMAEVRRALEADARAIEDAVASVPLTEIVQDAWRALEQPLPVAQGGWVVLSPSALGLRAVSPSSSGADIQGTVVLSARPGWMPSEPSTPNATPLPNAVSVGPEPTPEIELDAFLPFELLASEIRNALAAAPLSVAGRTLGVTRVEVRRSSMPGRITVAVGLGEDQGPVVRIDGAPYLDAESRVAGLNGIALSFEGFGFWVGTAIRVFRPVLGRRVAAAARFPVGELLDAAPGIGTSARFVVADGIELVGSFEEARVVGLGLSEDELVVRVRAVLRPLLTVRF